MVVLDLRTRRRPIDAKWRGLIYLAVTAAGWAVNWSAFKLLLREWPPLFSRGLAGLAASIILAFVAWYRHEKLTVPARTIPALLFAAFINVFAWMGFSSISLKWLSVSEAVLLAYTMPLWATLLVWPINGTRPTGRSLIALLLGLAAIAVLLSGRGLAFGPDKLIGIVLALSSAILFALGGILTKSPLPMPPIALVAWQVGLGCFPMVILGLLFEHPRLDALSSIGWTCLIYIALFPMGICYVTLFAARRLLPVTIASTGLLVVPVLGVAASAPILGAPFGLRETLAVMFTLSGLLLVLQRSDADGES